MQSLTWRGCYEVGECGSELLAAWLRIAFQSRSGSVMLREDSFGGPDAISQPGGWESSKTRVNLPRDMTGQEKLAAGIAR
jgi:hypothetical protein